MADAERVAIRRRVNGTANANRAACSGNIFNDDRLPKRLTHAISENARQGVGWAAGGERHDDGDRPRWIVFCASRCDARQYRSKCGNDQSISLIPPSGVLRALEEIIHS